jgi:hypothetical protein
MVQQLHTHRTQKQIAKRQLAAEAAKKKHKSKILMEVQM